VRGPAHAGFGHGLGQHRVAMGRNRPTTVPVFSFSKIDFHFNILENSINSQNSWKSL
jgi:hypothetical protein